MRQNNSVCFNKGESEPHGIGSPFIYSMNREELLACNYIIESKHGKPQYEPDGNQPPDFLLESGTAIEVRRLNQNYFGGEKVNGLEGDHFRLFRSLSNVLKEFDEDKPGDCYWVGLDYERPIGNLKKIKARSIEILQAFLRGPKSTPFKASLSENVRIELFKAERIDTDRFRISLDSDVNQGGWLIPIYVDNINYCIHEKEEKVFPYYCRYNEWWLILVDKISCIGIHDYQAVIELINKSKVFSRIIVIGYELPRKKFEIY